MASQFEDQQGDIAFRRRRPRPVTDYGSSIIQYISARRPTYKGALITETERPSVSYAIDVLPPSALKASPAESIPVRHLHTSLGKSKKPVTVVRWMPEGRRLLAGVHNGEFMLWNGMSFNFETVTAMGSSSLRAAEWSNRKDWLVAANDEGTVFYLQPTLNNPHQFKGHDASIRDLAFSPTDAKFVTASDDNTLKIWDFVSSTNESTFKDHGWDVKACDWHPTKGLVVSGSKDHSVRLWDPRTTRNLTTLHGHKNAITATVFSRVRDCLLATSGRDSQARIFDLRMMRDVAVLRGHEKGITTLAWHPIHPSLICTGGDDGALHSYLLSDPNTPPGISTAITSPYNTSDPRSAPPQSVYPAHRISHAHDSSIWSLDWHPIGHILASGSNDHYTRFWSRATPGSTTCFRDQFHLGEEGAEAQGTWDRKFGKRAQKDAEEEEERDEAEGLEDQNENNTYDPVDSSGIPGLPGLSAGGPTSSSMIPGMGMSFGSASGSGNIMPPIPPPGSSFGGPVPPPGALPPGVDPAAFSRLMAQAQLQGRAGAGGQYNLPIPPPLPPGSDFSHLHSQGPGMPLNLNLPHGFPPPPPPPPPQYIQPQSQNPDHSVSSFPGLGASLPDLGGIPGLGGGSGGAAGMPTLSTPESDAANARRRAPLPSQKDGFKAEQARGNFRIAR